MKRDLDLIRDLLLAAEAQEAGSGLSHDGRPWPRL
jgi:hypothetical protein